MNSQRPLARFFVETFRRALFTLLAGTMLLPAASAQLVSLRGQLRDQVDALRTSQSATAWETWKAAAGWASIDAALRSEESLDPAAIEKVRAKILASKTLDERAKTIAGTLQALAEAAQPLTDESRAEYLKSLEAQLVPVSEEELAAARARLKKQLALLNPKLLAYADKGKAWKTYLFWTETEQLLSEPVPPRDILRKLEARWAVAPLAWDIPQIRDCGTEVQALTVLLRRDPETIKQTAAQLTAAQAVLSKPLAGENLAAALPLLTTLAELDLGSRLINELRQPATPMTTMKMLPAYFGDKTAVNQDFPISGNYGGSNATGNGQIRGNRSTNLLPDASAARFRVNFAGTNTSQTSSSSQGVRVNSSATSQVNASKDFTFRPLGIVSSPATASATTSLQYTGIGVGGGRLYQSEARRRVQATRGNSEEQARQAVERGTRESLDKEGAKMIADFDKSYRRDVLQPLHLQSSFQPRITTDSTKAAAYWRINLLRPHELLPLPAAPELEPTMLQTTSHQTFPARMFEIRLGGNVLDHSNWQKVLGKQLAERLSKNENEEEATDSEWSILLPSENPCEFDFSENNVVRVKIRLQNFKNEDFENDNIDLKLKFDAQVVDGKWVLKRTAQPEVLFLADPATGKYADELSGRELSLRSMLRRRLAKMLGEEMALTPRDLGFPPHNGRELKFAEILCREQWLVMNLK